MMSCTGNSFSMVRTVRTSSHVLYVGAGRALACCGGGVCVVLPDWHPSSFGGNHQLNSRTSSPLKSTSLLLWCTWYVGKLAPIYCAGRASARSLALIETDISMKNGHVSCSRCQFFYEKREERKGKGKERALVYWLTLLHLFVSHLYVLTATLSGKLVKVVISNDEVLSLTPGRSYFALLFATQRLQTLIAPKV
jgi:hypothetical protein